MTLELVGLEPGPVVLDGFPLRDRVVVGALFERLADPLVSVLRTSDAPLAAASAQAGGDGVPDLDALGLDALDLAETAHTDHAAVTDLTTVPTLLNAGDGVDGYRRSVLAFLPPPDTTISLAFKPPPLPDPALVGGIAPPDVPNPDGGNADTPGTPDEPTTGTPGPVTTAPPPASSTPGEPGAPPPVPLTPENENF